jgi:hypothetical protein
LPERPVEGTFNADDALRSQHGGRHGHIAAGWVEMLKVGLITLFVMTMATLTVTASSLPVPPRAVIATADTGGL